MLNYNDWLELQTKEDIEWLLKEFRSLTIAYNDYVKKSYAHDVLGE